MKLSEAFAKLVEAFTKLLEKLFSAKTLWLILIIAALLATFLLVYANGTLPVVGGCKGVNDALGLCDWVQAQQKWISLVLLVALIIIAIQVVVWIFQGLVWVIKWLRDKLFVQPKSQAKT
jgi:hypothetical protein